jgi:hypothetical protein
VPLVAYVVLETDLLRSVLERGGSENVTTLSSRTIAWNAAFEMDRPWLQTWFGEGLSVKQIPVPGQYWSTQLLDSSWVSAFVQGGYLGIALVGVWSLALVVACLRAGRTWRPLLTGLLVFVLGRSFLESGLFDASASFITFILVSFAALDLTGTTRRVTATVPDEPRPRRPRTHGFTSRPSAPTTSSR